MKSSIRTVFSSFAIAACLIVAAGGGRSSADEYNSFIQRYQKKHQQLRSHFLSNVKVSALRNQFG